MKRYPKYKDSGIEWVEEIPEHWQNVQLKRCLRSISNGTTANQVDHITDFPVSRIETISRGIINTNKVGYLDKEDIVDKFILKKGDILLSHINSLEYVGNCAIFISEDLLIHGMNLLRLQSNQKTIPKFLLYYLKSNILKNQIQANSKHAINQVSLPSSSLKGLRIALPTNPEQQTIATYLDRKTHLIDTFIEKKQKQIDLLKEQRAAIINHAVTKSLNPNVKLKDSGIEWLGEIPEHWAVKKLKYTIRLINEQVENLDKYELLIALENIEGFTGKLLNGISSFEGSGNTFKKGDVLFNKLRPYLCKVVLTPQDGVAVGELLVFRPNDPINNRFLFYRILSTDFISIVNGSTYGAKMPRASWEFIRNLKIPLPPIIEQQSITDYLSKKTTRMDKSIEKQERQIELLKEYRTALISEVVTGKIDVRDVGEQEDRQLSRQTCCV